MGVFILSYWASDYPCSLVKFTVLFGIVLRNLQVRAVVAHTSPVLRRLGGWEWQVLVPGEEMGTGMVAQHLGKVWQTDTEIKCAQQG